MSNSQNMPPQQATEDVSAQVIETPYESRQTQGPIRNGRSRRRSVRPYRRRRERRRTPPRNIGSRNTGPRTGQTRRDDNTVSTEIDTRGVRSVSLNRREPLGPSNDANIEPIDEDGMYNYDVDDLMLDFDIADMLQSGGNVYGTYYTFLRGGSDVADNKEN